MGYHARLWFLKNTHSHGVPKHTSDHMLREAGLLRNVPEGYLATSGYDVGNAISADHVEAHEVGKLGGLARGNADGPFLSNTYFSEFVNQ